MCGSVRKDKSLRRSLISVSSRPTGKDTYQAAVARAAALVGGAAALSRRLQVPTSDLMHWIRGTSRPPMGIFLRLIDLVIEESRKPRFSPVEPSRKKPAAE